jgi:hypothetical protein
MVILKEKILVRSESGDKYPYLALKGKKTNWVFYVLLK